MMKKWTEDTELVDSISVNLLDALAVFPKRLVQVDALLRQFEMPLSQIQILVTLADGDLSVGQLSQRLGVAKPNITPLVDVLSARGLLERYRSLTDRRVVNVHLTEKGMALIEEIRQAVSKQIVEWHVQLNRSEAKELNTALSRLLRLMAAME